MSDLSIFEAFGNVYNPNRLDSQIFAQIGHFHEMRIQIFFRKNLLYRDWGHKGLQLQLSSCLFPFFCKSWV